MASAQRSSDSSGKTSIKKSEMGMQRKKKAHAEGMGFGGFGLLIRLRA